MIQTGIKIQSGGLKTGLFKYLYQVLTEDLVAKPEIYPTALETNTPKKQVKNKRIFIIYLQINCVEHKNFYLL